jgi:uncharacterized LabA/DUF88 family protein
MLFVDGENLTRRGQETLRSEGIPLRAGDLWQRDVFLWLPEAPADHAFFAYHGHQFTGQAWQGPRVREAARAYFYTSTTSDEPGWTDTRLALRSLGFEPRLFRRARGRSKAVDVALTTDVLVLAAEGRYEVAVIFAGDGDYVPLVEAVKRMGRHVVVGFFEGDGLNPELRIAADEFVDLTQHFVRSWAADKADRERLEAVEAEKTRGADESKASGESDAG